jgi:chloramphenicol 3-O-phosphotransferase
MVLVICGLIASGKSTVARAVAQLFERMGTDAAAIDLDLVYEMFQHDDAPKASVPTWRRARRAVAGLTDVLLRDGVGVVVIEGERDPTRGLSRDPGFLRRHYEQLQGNVRSRPATDLVVDTSSVGVEEAARTIVEWASVRAIIP